jgi:hypothetical protein
MLARSVCSGWWAQPSTTIGVAWMTPISVKTIALLW